MGYAAPYGAWFRCLPAGQVELTPVPMPVSCFCCHPVPVASPMGLYGYMQTLVQFHVARHVQKVIGFKVLGTSLNEVNNQR